MFNTFFQGFGVKPLDSVSFTTSATKGFQAIAAEAADYSKGAWNNGRALTEKMLHVKSPADLVELQSSFAKSACEDFFARATKIGNLYSDLSKEAFQELSKAAAWSGKHESSAAASPASPAVTPAPKNVAGKQSR